MKLWAKFIIGCLFLSSCNFLLPKLTDEELEGIYQRANGDLLLLSKEKGQFYMANPITNKKNRVYKVVENDEKVQFAGWEDTLTFFHDKDKTVVGLYLYSGETFFIKLQDVGLLEPTIGIDLSLFQPDYAVYNLFVGDYANSTLGHINILCSAEKLFLAFNDDSGNCFELLPHVSSECITNRVNRFYFCGCEVAFGDDLETMSIISSPKGYQDILRRSQPSLPADH